MFAEDAGTQNTSKEIDAKNLKRSKLLFQNVNGRDSGFPIANLGSFKYSSSSSSTLDGLAL